MVAAVPSSLPDAALSVEQQMVGPRWWIAHNLPPLL
jgi:hypothetical protein